MFAYDEGSKMAMNKVETMKRNRAFEQMLVNREENRKHFFKMKQNEYYSNLKDQHLKIQQAVFNSFYPKKTQERHFVQQIDPGLYTKSSPKKREFKETIVKAKEEEHSSPLEYQKYLDFKEMINCQKLKTLQRMVPKARSRSYKLEAEFGVRESDYEAKGQSLHYTVKKMQEKRKEKESPLKKTKARPYYSRLQDNEKKEIVIESWDDLKDAIGDERLPKEIPVAFKYRNHFLDSKNNSPVQREYIFRGTNPRFRESFCPGKSPKKPSTREFNSSLVEFETSFDKNYHQFYKKYTKTIEAILHVPTSMND